MALGNITLASGQSNITSQTWQAGATIAITSNELLHVPGTSVNFVDTGTGNVPPVTYNYVPFGASNSFTFAAAPVLTNGILPYAAVEGTGSSFDLASYGTNGAGGPATLAAYASYVPGQNYATNLATAGPTSNVRLTSGTTLTSNIVVNALLLVGNVGVIVGGGGTNYTLTVGSGSVVGFAASTLTGGATFSGGTVDFGSAEGNINVNTNVTFTSAISGTNGVTISGPGVVTLNSTDTYGGTTTYNGAGIQYGYLSLGNIGALSSGSVTLIGGDIYFNTQLNPNFAALGNAITLNNSVVQLGCGNRVTLTGPITLFGTDTILTSSSTLIRSAIGGPGTLAIDGGGSENALETGLISSIVITLEGTDTYTGGTLLDPGAIWPSPTAVPWAQDPSNGWGAPSNPPPSLRKQRPCRSQPARRLPSATPSSLPIPR